MTALHHQALPDSKRAGASLHLSSLPGPYGIGELGEDAIRFVDRLKRMGLGHWQFLPTGPTAYGDSPYQPLSTFAGNEHLVSVGALVDSELLTPSEVSTLAQLPANTVDYGRLIPLKRPLLELAATRFLRTATSAQRGAFADFLQRNDVQWLHDYALFRVLKSRHGERPWNEWPAEYRHRDASALERIASAEHDTIERTKVIQYFFFSQWEALRQHAKKSGITLFGDMPIYIALDSSDAWVRRDLLLLDNDGIPSAVAGVPPDYFSEDGQLWGNPLYAWPTHERNGFAWWIQRIKASLQLADIVRIDHFRGFESFWSVPASATTARDGSWEPGAGDALFHALRDALGSLPLVAEDLGLITPEVDALRHRHNIPGMRVLQFDVCDPHFALGQIDAGSVCYTGTHDNDTTRGWFHGSPDDIRSTQIIQETQQRALDITNGSPETIHLDMIRAAFSTAAQLAIAPLQDYLGLGSESRMNVPGTSANNWRWRVSDSQLSPEVCDNIAELVSASGRSLKS